MTRRQKLINNMTEKTNYEHGLFLGNMPKTILTNPYTRDLSIIANAVLLQKYENAKIQLRNLDINPLYSL